MIITNKLNDRKHSIISKNDISLVAGSSEMEKIAGNEIDSIDE